MPTFSEVFDSVPVEALRQQALDTTERTLLPVLQRGRALSLADFAALISPAAQPHLETLGMLSQRLTQRHFGKTIRLFAPLYLSNECVNICKYCGFSRHNDIPRITLPVPMVVEQAQRLAKQGFRSILVVAGEHPKFVSNGYVEEVIQSLLPIAPSILLELGPLKTDPYKPFVAAGAEGLVVYQETYHKPTYQELHVAGPKKRYHWRMDAAERAFDAGFRRLGIGALFGLYDWRYDAIALAAHALYLTRRCWKAQLSISLPRMRPAAGDFKQSHFMTDREFVQVMCALRLLLPHASIVLSTREAPRLRDGLISLGVTSMSAGSCTEPGGYSSYDEASWTSSNAHEGEQFHISDERSPAQVADVIRSRGYEPVWKDFDEAIVKERNREEISA